MRLMRVNEWDYDNVHVAIPGIDAEDTELCSMELGFDYGLVY